MTNPFALRTEAVLFDLDGTLIDTHIDFPLMRREMLRLAHEHGCSSDDLAGLDILAIVAQCCERLTALGDSDGARSMRARSFDRLREIETDHCSEPEEIPAAAELLARLRSVGIRVGIVTRNCREVSEELVQRGNLACDALVTRDDVERTKPDPEHLFVALRQLGLEPSDSPAAIMVGDHWMDVLAGHRAGCRTVGLLRGRDGSWFDRARPDTLLDGVGDLLPMLDAARGYVTRRTLFAAAGATAFAGGAWSGNGDASGPSSDARKGAQKMDLSGVPSCCTHEHWGSLASFGMEPEGFRADVLRGAVPQRRTGLFDVILDPYFGGWLAGAGVDLASVAREAGVADLHGAGPDTVERCWDALRPHIEPFTMAGVYQTLRRGLLGLYGMDIAEGRASAIVELDRRIGDAYGSLYAWYESSMRRARLIRPIRPVHPEFFWKSDAAGDPAGEDRVFRPILRIDPLLELWPENCPRRDALAALTGVDPSDARTWRAFLAALMERAAEHGCVGIKQLQAYSRSLDFAPVGDDDVVFRGSLNDSQRKVFGDWVVHECCKLAHDRGWPHQIHVGTANLPLSNPLPLGAMAMRYRRMSLVLLHCWPYLNEAGWLAWQHPNIYLDGCWMPVINPAYLREGLARWLGLFSHAKVMCGHDATSIEMAVGSAYVVRDAVGAYLGEAVRNGTISERMAGEIAHDLLHRNAERLYRSAA